MKIPRELLLAVVINTGIGVVCIGLLKPPQHKWTASTTAVDETATAVPSISLEELMNDVKLEKPAIPYNGMKLLMPAGEPFVVPGLKIRMANGRELECLRTTESETAHIVCDYKE